MSQIELSQMCSSFRGKFAFALRSDEQLQKKKGREGIVIAELWFHLARLGLPAGTSYSVLLLLSHIAEWSASRYKADIESRSEQWPKCQLHCSQAQFKGSRQQIDHT